MKRQSAVTAFYNDFHAREELRELLRSVLDLERLGTKVVYGTASGKDLRAIAQTADKIPEIKEIIKDLPSQRLNEIYMTLDELGDIKDIICRAIVDDPPFSVREGGIIKDGFDGNVDKLRSVMKDGKYWISRIEETEREATGIKTLRVAYNRVFGYYIEVTKSNLADVPERYIRKQTLANCERFITEELKEFEATVLGASDKIVKLEYDIFCNIRDFVNENIIRIRDVASKLSELDVYLSLASVAVKNRYTAPEVDLSDMIVIEGGRHPVVEQFSSGTFVPNDTLLDTNLNRLMLITGPNMAGKSTYMRQNALIVIMAQIGSYVPADSARIGICDKVFTRVGASDDLASGTSTFMLEMNEVAYILSNATKRSLIIYDEIGRGTSTYDGMSIARATAEYTAGKKLGAKTLFATHYHELTELENTNEGIVNYNIAAKKRGDDLIFLRKIVRGAADDSYGIEVAKLAGVPSPVIKRAKEILSAIESGTPDVRRKKEASSIEDFNISLESVANDEIREKLRGVDLNIITPVDAFDILRKLKSLL
jgi:DNA mismatch repair protein MutS